MFSATEYAVVCSCKKQTNNKQQQQQQNSNETDQEDPVG